MIKVYPDTDDSLYHSWHFFQCHPAGWSRDTNGSNTTISEIIYRYGDAADSRVMFFIIDCVSLVSDGFQMVVQVAVISDCAHGIGFEVIGNGGVCKRE